MPALARFLRGLPFLLFACVAQAAPDIPAALEPWRGWVLHEQEYRTCPLIAGHAGDTANDYLCAWPGVLNLSAGVSGADIAQHWRVEAETWIPLPGDAEHWPQQVTVNSQTAVVVDRGGPHLRLAPGSYEIRAHIPWRERPQSLRVPETAGLIALNVDGRQVTPVQRDGMALTLGRASIGTPEVDSLQLRVYRRLSDGVPAELTTVIELHASGQAREETVGPALPEGFVPLALSSEWPARLDADGRLRLRVQPGSDVLTLDARAAAPVAAVSTHLPSVPWPKQEIWSYAASPRLRVSVASGEVQVDPRQVGVPSGWTDLPAFALADGATLTIEERSRGLAMDDRNRLSLDREMWLDFDGGGWFARDRLQGEMLQGWRFDAAAPFALERAEALGANYRDKNESLVVTRGAKPELSGVEWRMPAVDLAAGLRVAPIGAVLPITGWQDTFDRVTTILHLPNGYKLLGAPGADRAPGSWIAQWTLLDVFIAAVLVLLAGRLFGVPGGVVAVIYLVIGYQEAGSPLWSLLAVIAISLAVRALPDGRLAVGTEWLRRAALLLFVLTTLPFVAAQLRYALYPQLENDEVFAFAELGVDSGIVSPAPSSSPEAVEMQAPPAPPAPAPRDAAGGSVQKYSRDSNNDKLQTITVTGSNIRRLDIIDHYSESTVVQTGAGEPDWTLGSRYELGWSGPVLPTQEVRLVIAPPWLVRTLRVVLVALLAWLLMLLLRPSLPGALPRNAVGAVIGMIVFASIAASPAARAQTFPPDSLLDVLHTRLVEAPKCAPACASIAKAETSAQGDEIRVALEAHAAERIALPLPIDEMTLSLRSIEVDGVAQGTIARRDSALWIALPRGVHRVELVFAAAADKIALAFPLKPMRARFSGDGWEATGIEDDRLLTETITLVRARAASEAPPSNGTQQFIPFVRIDRSLSLGIDWNIVTTATRLAPRNGGFTVAVPVLAGEHVSSAGFKVDNGRVTAAIADGEERVQWESTLDKGDTLSLTAPALTDHAEVWYVLISPTWHVEFDGVPGVAIGSDEGADDYRNFEFHPLPGETLTLRITRPEAVRGATRAIDAVRLMHTVGQRATNSTLALSVRASQGGEQVITLPREAEVLGVSRNGEALNLRAQNGRVSLPIVPGMQDFELRFRDNMPAGLVARTPQVALGLPAANIDLAIELPADRWLLATSGPTSGPAVLYWGELIVMLLLAFALSRSRHSPLKLWQWVLLGIGFSTFSWIALLLVAAWLFALDWRARAVPRPVAAFNLVQIGLPLLTLVALLCLLGAVKHGLLGTPDMAVTGNGSSAHSLHWFADRSSDALPIGRAISLPLWLHKLAMLAWALWLASALVGWLRRGVVAWSAGGYWRRTPKPLVDAPGVEPPRV